MKFPHILPFLLLGACAAPSPTIPSQMASKHPGLPQANSFESPTLTRITPLPHDVASFGSITLSPDETELLFTATDQGLACPQIYRSQIDGSETRLVSTGQGEAESPLFGPHMRSILYASTHRTQARCAPTASPGIPLSPHMDIWQADPDGQHPTPLIELPDYQGNLAMSPDGTKLVYTSVQQGDANLFLLDLTSPSSAPIQLTTAFGYETDPAWSPDGSTIAFSAYYPTTDADTTAYRTALADHHVNPSSLDLYLLDLPTTTPTLLLSCPHRRCILPAFSPASPTLLFASDLDAPHPAARLALFSLPLLPPYVPTRLTFGPHHVDFAPQFGRSSHELFWRTDRLEENKFSMIHSPLTLPRRINPATPSPSLADDLKAFTPPDPLLPDPSPPQDTLIRARFRTLGLLPLTPDYTQRFTLPSTHAITNLIARLPATPSSTAPTSQHLVLATHHDPAGLATLFATLQALTAQKGRLYDVVVVVLDGPGPEASDAFIQHPVTTSRPLALLYLDHPSAPLLLEDTGAPTALKELVRFHQSQTALSWQQGTPSSPHMPFLRQRIPTLSFFSPPTVPHPTPQDLTDPTALVISIATALLQSPRDLVFALPPHHPTPPPAQAKATFGSMPSYTPAPDGTQGVLVAGVIADSPAQKAGLLKGDVITQFGPTPIASPEELMRALEASQPGDTLEVHITRQGTPIILKATLTPRTASH